MCLVLDTRFRMHEEFKAITSKSSTGTVCSCAFVFSFLSVFVYELNFLFILVSELLIKFVCFSGNKKKP